MQKITLYRYISGGVTVSMEKSKTEYTELTQLVVDEGIFSPIAKQLPHALTRTTLIYELKKKKQKN